MTERRAAWSLVAIVFVVWAGSQWWVSSGERRIGRQVAKAAAPGDIQMLSSTTCPICTRARLWFRQHEVHFDECFIEKEAACAARFGALGAPGTPVIIVRGQAQLGFDPQRLLRRLDPS